ncbi:hypothetical protein B0H16DRAFT_1299532, partial [Mycena metata]
MPANTIKNKKPKKINVQKSKAYVKHAEDGIAKEARSLRFNRKLGGNDIHFEAFPPTPLGTTDVHRILTGMAGRFNPEEFVESGCAVCGMLYPQDKLSPLAEYPGELSCLEMPGVTRKERRHTDEPIEEINGPVLAENCTALCVYCEGALAKGKIPENALAKFCWIGPVPEELQGLTYAEGVMIARIRHNRCVMRVNSGRVRMHANAIMFAQPAAKVF